MKLNSRYNLSCTKIDTQYEVLGLQSFLVSRSAGDLVVGQVTAKGLDRCWERELVYTAAMTCFAACPQVVQGIGLRFFNGTERTCRHVFGATHRPYPLRQIEGIENRV